MNGMEGRFRSGESEEASLTLTPLLDMFTIILIFLIVSFQAEDKGFEPNENVDLPESRARSVFKPAVNISIAEDAVSVEKERVVELNEGSFDPKFYDQQKVPPLVEKLDTYFEAIKGEESAADLELPKTDKTILLVQADKRLDYRTLYLVLRSGALAGFTKYRLAIMKQ